MKASFKILKISNPVDKVLWIDEIWNILEEAYRDVKGGLLFRDRNELVHSTSIWKIAVKKEKVVAVTIFKRKYGQKLVAMGINRSIDGKLTKRAITVLLRNSLEHAWMELSEVAEIFVMKHCGGEKFLIHNSAARTYLEKAVDTIDDGYHYVRTIAGISKQKILLGTLGV